MKIAQNRKKVQSVRRNKEEFHDSYSIIGYIECVEKLQTGKCGMLKRREVCEGKERLKIEVFLL